MVVEICANSIESAINAEKAGATRIELCSELAIGGITPSHGLIQLVVEKLSIPVHVLIRPRSGDFTYSNDELTIMKKDILFCKEMGCKGIVSGVLNEDFSVNLEQTKDLIDIASGMHFTFHRAFDWVTSPSTSLKQLIGIGCQTILTSGQETSAEKGINLLIKLKELANDKCIIMPGGGINTNNAALFKKSGFTVIHCSATLLENKMKSIPKVSMNSDKFFDETVLATSNISKIKEIIAQVS